VRAWRAAAGTGFALLLNAVLSAAPARAAGVYVAGVPNVPEAQWTANCGPASLTDVLRFYDPSISYERVFGAVYDRVTDSTFLVKMADEAASLGFHVETLAFASERDAGLSWLKHQLSLGHPVIVGATASLEDPTLHLRVVVGIDERDVWMIDPLYGPGYVLSRADFLRTLAGGANEELAVWRALPPAMLRRVVTHELPRWPDPTPHQLAVRAVERAYDRAEQGDPAGAARRLHQEDAAFAGREDREVAESWVTIWGMRAGETTLALRALGGSLYRDDAELRARLLLERGEAARAEALLTARRESLDAVGWLLLGDARRLLGRRSAARTAYERAAALDDVGRLSDDLSWRMTLVTR